MKMPNDERLCGSILMVDDMPTNLKVLTKVLTRAGHQVRPALDGKIALDAARSLLPDLVLLDVNMPGMSGYDVCAAFKSDPQLCDVPIIFVSAADEALDKIRAFQVGAVDYVTKPFDAQEVLARVQTHLALAYGRKEQRAFGRMVAHEINNPLTHIILQIEAGLIAGGLGWQDLLNLKDGALKIQSIVRAMLALSRLHKPHVEVEPLDMRPLVDRAARTLEPLLSEREAELVVPSDLPQALGYGPWVEQVWINYLTNAIKYGGRPPRIEIGWTRDDEGIRFTVSDNGVGLAPEEQAVVFDEFSRLNHIEVDGHGLGLAIVQRVVTRMNGTVGLESRPQGGSTFFFRLPAA